MVASPATPNPIRRSVVRTAAVRTAARNVVLAILCLSVLVTVSSCRHKKRRSTVAANPEVFSLDIDFHNDYGENYYYWTTDLDQVRVNFRVRHFDHGDARLRIYDADGYKVFDRDYCACEDGYWDHWGGDEYEDVDFTGIGEPGRWTIRLEYWNFDGHCYLNLD